MDGKLEITLVRHGETAWSLNGRHTGLTDLELTPNGISQASQIKTKLAKKNFDYVFCSPLKRAVQTATFAGLFEKAEILAELTEWNYGDYEGLTTEQIRLNSPSWNVFRHGADKGESPNQIAERADKLIARFRALEGNIALVSSAHFLRSFAARWIGMPVAMAQHFFLATASISMLGYEREVPSIKLWNETQTISGTSRG